MEKSFRQNDCCGKHRACKTSTTRFIAAGFDEIFLEKRLKQNKKFLKNKWL
jgi:hypothetical protein